MADIEDQQDGEEDPETLDDEEDADDPAEEEEEFEEDWTGIPPDEEEKAEERSAQDSLTDEQKARLKAARKHYHALGYGATFEQIVRDQIPGVPAGLRRKAEIEAAKAAERKDLLKQYPSMAGPQDAA